ncbi:hypothetical protein CYLTODRAFT_460740 [Cylindrobasidium torrendii FP15055 ss-10]|uniref:BZIP domain-containing protein n=1 Tax=Cylindrobasidium torrendii FP15055 ss-10 TaxID=1314674 RepID=A0A0D7AR55_9AGAR|nr:hypothetical protein CYLTODRAFT_460740 [Cylindrobasidium torrendii FP15055 ss-10]
MNCAASNAACDAGLLAAEAREVFDADDAAAPTPPMQERSPVDRPSPRHPFLLDGRDRVGRLASKLFDARKKLKKEQIKNIKLAARVAELEARADRAEKDRVTQLDACDARAENDRAKVRQCIARLEDAMAALKADWEPRRGEIEWEESSDSEVSLSSDPSSMGLGLNMFTD